MYYHGTNSNLEFNTLELNNLGLLWVTKDKQAAFKYASKYYNQGIQRIFHINLKGEVLDFTDKNNEVVKEIIQKIKSSYLFDIEKHWESSAAFDILESNLWIIDDIKTKGYVGIHLLDRAVGLDHTSIALFNDNYIIEEIEYL